MPRRSRRPIQATVKTSPVDSETELGNDFREALSQWASGVAILAVSDGEEIDALTVSSFAALSIEPPLVLVGVGEQTAILPMLREEGRFTISILTEQQRTLAGAIAQRLPGWDLPFHRVEEPVVDSALAVLDCVMWQDYPGGDHRIIVGRVERVTLGAGKPLVYFGREYRGLR